MYRWVPLVVLVGCEAPEEDVVDPPPAAYPAAPAAWPLGVATARIGRGAAPQIAAARTISSSFEEPIVSPTPWQVPGDGPARAVVAGLVGGKPAIELVEVDAARVVWQDTSRCAAPVVGVTADAIVCGDGRGTRALGLDGKLLWQADAPFLAITGARIVTRTTSTEVAIRDARTGATTVASVPSGTTVDSVVATCDQDVYTATSDGKLARIVPHGTPPARPINQRPAKPPIGPSAAWTLALGGSIAAIDACEGATVVVTIATAVGTSLVAIGRDTGKLVGRVDGVRGYWPARHDPARLEIATAVGVARWSRDLSTSEPMEIPVLGELLSSRGERRLVRATPLTAALIDKRGVRAYVPLGELGAVLGDDTILAASWLGSPHRTARSFAIPRSLEHAPRIATNHAPIAVPAELRDLPQAIELDVSRAVAFETAAKRGVVGVALDPIEPAIYTATVDETVGVARFELRTRTWQWYRRDGCGAGAPIGLAAARDVVTCATQQAGAASVRATDRGGAARWEWRGPNVDAIDAAGDVVLVRDADRLIVIDAADGRGLGSIASDDGMAVRAAAIDVGGMTMVVTYERGRIVARLPRVAMVPAWSVAVAGVVRDLVASGDGVLVALEDGDAYRIDARTGAVVALAGFGLAWRAAGDLVTGEAAGGPTPPRHMALPRELPNIYHPTDLQAAPAIATPWPAPPPMPESWQYTLYELGGGVRARNDYGLDLPITPGAARGGGASPLVVASGERELLVIEPLRGDPVRRVRLPEGAPKVTFATVVDGRPLAGTILAAPLRVVVF